MWRKVGKQGIFYPPQRLLPGLMAWNRINRNTQNLGIEAFESLRFAIVSRNLIGSDRGPVKGIKRQEDIFLPQIIGKPDSPSQM
jgi:hypothetical protein